MKKDIEIITQKSVMNKENKQKNQMILKNPEELINME